MSIEAWYTYSYKRDSQKCLHNHNVQPSPSPALIITLAVIASIARFLISVRWSICGSARKTHIQYTYTIYICMLTARHAKKKRKKTSVQHKTKRQKIRKRGGKGKAINIRVRAHVWRVRVRCCFWTNGEEEVEEKFAREEKEEHLRRGSLEGRYDGSWRHAPRTVMLLGHHRSISRDSLLLKLSYPSYNHVYVYKTPPRHVSSYIIRA